MAKSKARESAPPVVRRVVRTVFPRHVDFTGWWGVSPKKRLVQLEKAGLNKHGSFTFFMVHQAEGALPAIIGAGEYSMEWMLEHGFWFYPTKDDAAEAVKK